MALRAARFAFKTRYNIGGDHVAYSELLGVVVACYSDLCNKVRYYE